MGEYFTNRHFFQMTVLTGLLRNFYKIRHLLFKVFKTRITRIKTNDAKQKGTDGNERTLFFVPCTIVNFSSLITHHSSLITHHSSLITHHSSLITHHSSLITHHSSLITHHSLYFTVVFHQTLHWVFQYLTQLKFIAVAKRLQHIFKPVCYTAYKVDGQLPHLAILAQMIKEKIVEPIFNNIFNHIVASITGQEKGKCSQVAVGHRLLVHVFQNFYRRGYILRIKAGP